MCTTSSDNKSFDFSIDKLKEAIEMVNQIEPFYKFAKKLKPDFDPEKHTMLLNSDLVMTCMGGNENTPYYVILSPYAEKDSVVFIDNEKIKFMNPFVELKRKEQDQWTLNQLILGSSNFIL